MAISELFNDRLQQVDPARSFSFLIDAGYGDGEWSVDGWTVTGGSDIACEHGASEALYRMGWRFFTPTKTIVPGAVPAGGVTIARTERYFNDAQIFATYGFGSVDETKDAWNDWRVLNGVRQMRMVAGHAYPAIINAIEAEDGFFTANPTFKSGSGATQTFNLDLDAPDYAALVNRVGDFLAQNLNEFNRASIDPPDGDDWPTDKVMDFASAVCDRIRMSVPDALLGVYAYAGHRAPPTNAHPNVYVQIALGFGHEGYGYIGLVEAWGPKVHSVLLRGYGHIGAQDEWHPFERGINKETSFVNATFDFNAMHAAGAIGLNMETSPQFLPGLVGFYRLVRFIANGTQTFAETLADIVDNLYDGDPGVSALFRYWGDEDTSFNASSLKTSCELVDAIAPENRPEFERYMAWLLLWWDVSENEERHSPTYFTKLERLLRWAKGMELDQTVHTYGFSRQLANTNVHGNGRPDLRFSVQPHWFRYGAKPTAADYVVLRDAHAATIFRPAALDDDELVLVHTGLAPDDAATFRIEDSSANGKFLGPGSVTCDDETFHFGPGMHDVKLSGIVTWDAGTLFVKMSPRIRIEHISGGQSRWIYLPKICRGRYQVLPSPVFTFEDDEGNGTEFKLESGERIPSGIKPGIAKMKASNTSGFNTVLNLGDWISTNAAYMLLPRALAEIEFPDAVIG